MKNFRIILMVFMFALLNISCQKEEQVTSIKEGQGKVSIRSQKDVQAYNFFDYHYVEKLLNIPVRVEGYYPQLEDAIHHLDLKSDQLYQVDWLIKHDLYPCWSCAEAEFDEIKRFLIPIYNTTNSELQSILISEEDQGDFTFEYFLPEVYYSKKPAVDIQSKNYWETVEGFFAIGTGFTGADEIFASKGKTCYRVSMGTIGGQTSKGCACSPNDEDEFSCTGGDQTVDCTNSKCPVSDSGSGGTGTNTGGNNDGWWPINPHWEVFTVITGGGSDSTGTNGTGIDINNEQDVFNHVMWYLQTKIADVDNTVDGIPINDIKLLLGGNPNYTITIFLYVTNQLGVTATSDVVEDIIKLLHTIENTNPSIALSVEELEYLLTTNPDLIPRITSLLNSSQGDIEMRNKLVHQFIQLEQETDIVFSSIKALNKTFQLYQTFSDEQQAWIDDNSITRNVIYRKYIQSSFTFSTDVIKSLIDMHRLNPQLSLSGSDDEYLLDNPSVLDDCQTIIDENNGDDYALSSVEVITKLSRNDLLDMTYTDLVALESTLDAIINTSLNAHNLGDRTAISASTWYMIFQTEANANGSNPLAWLRAEITALKDGFLEVLKPVENILKPILEQLEVDDLPSTQEEWKAIIAIYGPMLTQLGIDVGTDFIPVVGEIKGIANMMVALLDGNYGTAGIEFIGTIAGIVPIGDLVKGSSKVLAAATTIFAAWKVIKALSKVSSGIYSKLIDLANAGWKVVWNDGLKKIIFKNADNVDVVEIVDDVDNLSPNVIIKNPAGKTLLLTNSIKNLEAVDISSSAAQSLANTVKKNPANHMRFTPNTPAQQNAINNILTNGDESGELTELFMKDHLAQDGWIHQTGGKYGSDNGYDNVFYNPNTGEVLIDESKQWGPKLSGETATNPKQMSDAWIDKVANKIEDAGDLTLANKVRAAKNNGKLTKTVSSVKKTNPGKGSIITIKVSG